LVVRPVDDERRGFGVAEWIAVGRDEAVERRRGAQRRLGCDHVVGHAAAKAKAGHADPIAQHKRLLTQVGHRPLEIGDELLRRAGSRQRGAALVVRHVGRAALVREQIEVQAHVAVLGIAARHITEVLAGAGVLVADHDRRIAAGSARPGEVRHHRRAVGGRERHVGGDQAGITFRDGEWALGCGLLARPGRRRGQGIGVCRRDPQSK